MEEEKDKKTPKGGRPKKAVKRESNLGFFVTSFEKSIILAKAKQAGLRPADYIRELSLTGKVKSRPTAEELKLYHDIRGIANNLNQLTKEAHKEGISSITSKLVRTLDQVNESLNKLRNDYKD